jgi:ABC-2 type transport system permease protein
VIPNADASAAIVDAIILPLLFLSGIFIPFGNDTPQWILWVARIFPVKHFADGCRPGSSAPPSTGPTCWWSPAGRAETYGRFRWQRTGGGIRLGITD